MKKRFYLYLFCVLAGVLTYLGYEKIFGKQCCNVNSSSNNTEVCVVNSTSDSVIVYLTVGADTNYVTDVNGIFGIEESGKQGFFILSPKDTVRYTSVNKGFNGNLSFGTPANNCPDTTIYPFGINIFEFALNNNFHSTPNAQETVDNSCVAGVNCKIICNFSDSNWNAGDTVGFKTFENSFLYDNVGRIGVFPFGCDSCTVIKNPPTCLNKKFSQTQKKSICNVQRNATLKGGKVYVIYGGKLKGVIN